MINFMTEKQRSFILSLLKDRVVVNEGSIRTELGNEVPRYRASQIINNLLKQPRKESTVTQSSFFPEPLFPEVSEGRYAVEVEGTLKFYRVDRPVKGRWAGYTFVNVQASDDFYPVRDFNVKRTILELIAKDPKGSMLRYGQQLGSCGHCGKTLTDENSRQLGIGPVCLAKMKW